jgi:hypothetical protein
MDSTETMQAYSTRCAAAVRRYCQTIRKDPGFLPDELRLDILKWVLAGLPKSVASVINGLREHRWIEETQKNTLPPLRMLEELGTIDELMRFIQEVKTHRTNIHGPAARPAGHAGREARGHIHALFDSESDEEVPEEEVEEEECLFALDASRPASSYYEDFTCIFLAGENRFAAPEDAVKPSAKVVFQLRKERSP